VKTKGGIINNKENDKTKRTKDQNNKQQAIAQQRKFKAQISQHNLAKASW